MKYFVSGGARVGSSLMMSILGESGIKINYSKEYEAVLQQFNKPDYLVNKMFYETGFVGRLTNKYISELEDLSATKISLKAVSEIRDFSNVKIILMTRDITSSWLSFKHSFLKEGVPFDKDLWLTKTSAQVEVSRRLAAKHPTKLMEVDYNKLIENPITTLSLLKDFGIPLNTELGVKSINPKLRRFY